MKKILYILKLKNRYFINISKKKMKDLIILPYSGGACKPTSGIASTIS
jgi:hypothetical protein